MEFILMCGLVIYMILGLVQVAVTTGELLDEEDFIMRHLITLIVFLPITIVAGFILLVAYVIYYIGDKLNTNTIRKFLDKKIIKR